MLALPFSPPSCSLPGLIGTGLLLDFSNGATGQIRDAIWVIDKEMPQQQTRNGANLKTALGRLVTGWIWHRKDAPMMGRTCAASGALTP